ncbi:MAG: hypothetical protein K6U74_21050 [Firmicutes bacterium]|nr:hypothetical protein [Bacillota bacterium]
MVLALKVLEGQKINRDIYWTPLALVIKDNVNTFDGWKLLRICSLSPAAFSRRSYKGNMP